MTAPSSTTDRRTAPANSLVDRLRAIALRGLTGMYRPDQQLFVHHLRRAGGETTPAGESVRYTAIVLIALANEPEATARQVLGDDRPEDVCDRLLKLNDDARLGNLGDVALIYWAARAIGRPRTDATLRRLAELLAYSHRHQTVELAWTLAALCEKVESEGVAALRNEAARRLVQAYNDRSAIFAHVAGSNRIGWRGHVACFADLVYPIHALARYHAVVSAPEVLRIANRCADRMCSLLGSAGQWWWHYDARTGEVIERYPVYAVHQDAMAPMALSALTRAGGNDHSAAIAKGLAWLERAPELDDGSLIDEAAGVIWRKVARRESRKFVRRAQAVAARIHPTLRWPATDTLFPAGVVDDECRPYHLGWLLYAWPARRARLAAIEA